MAIFGSPIQKVYLLIGSILSLFYVLVGILFLTGVIAFGIEYNARLIIGTGILAYGFFRVYMFYKRYKRMSEEDKNA